MKRGTPEFKKLSSKLRSLVPDIMELFECSREQAIEWLNVSNVVFDGKSPIQLFVTKRGTEVIKYLSELKRSNNVN